MAFGLLTSELRSQTAPRPWSPYVVSGGGALANSALDGSEEESPFSISYFLTAGVRFHDFVGLGVERRGWKGSQSDQRNFELVTFDFFPLYRAGTPQLRINAGVGRASIDARFLWGRDSETIVRGRTSAAMFGLAYDVRSGGGVISPFFSHTRSMGHGLQTAECSSPGYFSGDPTRVCQEREYSKPVSVTSLGFSIGIR